MTNCCADISSQCPRPQALAAATSWGRLVAALFIAGNSMVLSLIFNTSELQSGQRTAMTGFLIAATCTVIGLAGGALGRDLLQAWRQKKTGLEILFVSGIAGAACYSAVSVWRGRGDIYFEVVSLLVVIYGLSTKVKRNSQQQLLAAIQSTLPTASQCRRWNREARAWQGVPVGQLVPGDEVRVDAGENIPVDGTIVEGSAYMNEASVTGEGFCIARHGGDAVKAGTQNLDGTLRIRTADGGTHSLQQQMNTLLQQILSGSAPRGHTETQVERLARWFFPCVAGIAMSTFAFWLVVAGFTTAFLNAMAVLLVACPCALGFATPIAVWLSVARLARLGFHVQNTAAVERLADLDTVMFDKTGTLTTVTPMAQGLQLLQACPISAEELLAKVCAAQGLSDHPIARAFTSLSCKARAPQPHLFRVLPGRGIEATFSEPRGYEQTLMVGDLRGLADPEQVQTWTQTSPAAAHDPRQLGIFIDGQLSALAYVQDEALAHVRPTFLRLRRMGIDCSIISGDRAARLQGFGAYGVTGDASAQQKAAAVKSKQNKGHKVCFVGDGLNDFAALACSNVSIAVASGAPVAVATADLVTPQETLQHLPDAIAISRQGLRVIRGNLAFGVAYNVVGMVVAATGWLHPVFASALMLCASLSVTLRSTSLLHRLDEPAV